MTCASRPCPPCSAKRSSCASWTSPACCSASTSWASRPDVQTKLEELASQPNGMLLTTGPTGSGKTTTLYSVLQQDQLGREEHHHRRGPGRVPAARRLAGADQQEGGPDLRRRPALLPAPGPGHHHGRGDARPGDRPDRRRGVPDRPPGALDAAHQRRAVRRDAPRRHGHRVLSDRRDRHRHHRPAPLPQDLHQLQGALRGQRRRAVPLRLRGRRPEPDRHPLPGRRAATSAASRATRAASACTR